MSTQTFDQLANEIDPAELDEQSAKKMRLRNPQELYELWERQHWQSQTLDFEQDKKDWANLPEDTEGRHHLVPGLLLHRRGAGDHPVLGTRHGLRRRAGGGLPHDPAGRRGAAHAVLRPLLPRGRGHRQRPHGGPPGPGPRGAQRRVHRALRHASREGRRDADQGPLRPRRQGRVRDDLPHDHRGRPGPHRPALHHRVLREGGHPARLRRGLQERRDRRAPPHRLRHVVPQRDRRRRRRAAPGARRTSCRSCCPPPPRSSFPRARTRPSRGPCWATPPTRSTSSRSPRCRGA